MIQNFFLHPQYALYDFGPKHPLKPARVGATLEALNDVASPIVPSPFREEDLLLVHDSDYVEFVKTAHLQAPETQFGYGFSSGDTPAFPGLFEAASTYVAATSDAARAVLDGANRAFSISGGLHHARRAEASGFCVFDDVAIACAILRQKFERVMYIDIDLHHGDGVQWIFYTDPRVMTFSIHESGRTLYPGTGFVDETGANFTKVNLPMVARTSGDVWLESFRTCFTIAVKKFKPLALVLQMGADAHTTDPLGHLQVSVQDWLEAVRCVHNADLPTVATGGGGYDLHNPPRMWSSAVRILSDLPINADLPEGLTNPYGTRSILDPESEIMSDSGRAEAAEVVSAVTRNLNQISI